MSTEETKKHWVAHAPSILTGLAALVAALTTVYINVRNDKSAASVVAQTTSAAVSSTAAITPEKTLPAQAKIIDLQLERMRVRPGRTSARFQDRARSHTATRDAARNPREKAGRNARP